VRILFIVALAACARNVEVVDEPSIPDVAGLMPERTFYVRTSSGALFGGFDRALDRAIEVEGAPLAPDENGRFAISLPAKETIEVEGLTYRLRDPGSALLEAVRPALSGAGSVPNDLLIAGGADAYGVLVRSGDAGVSVIDLSRGLSDEGVRIDGHPFFAGIVDAQARRIAVSDYDGGEIHLIDLAAGTVERTLSAPEVVLDDESPFVARSPQSVVRAEDRLIAGYTGFVETGPPAIYLPGVIASWSLADLDAPPRLLVLDVLNPQELRVLEDGRVLAVCSGAIEHQGGAHASTRGALVFFDPAALSVVETIEMQDFAPGSALIAADRIVVASVVRPRVRIIDGEEIVVNDETVDSIFRLVDLGGGLVGVPSFDSDRLHVLDARTGELDPPPFYAPIAVGPGRPILDGLQIVAARPGRRGIDFVGPDLFALTGIASEVVPIELRKVLGP
jgi:hypothetical protein